MPEKHLAPARHETEDVTGRFIWLGAAVILGSAALLAWLAFLLFPDSLRDRQLGRSLPKYPAPELQIFPRGDMERFRAEEMRILNGSGWVDKARGIVHIPISEAMRGVASSGIPDWPAEAEKPP